MPRRRTYGVSVALAVAVGLWLTLGPTIRSATIQSNAESCVVTLSGSELANELPSHDLWEDAFRRASADVPLPGASLLSANARRRLNENSKEALRRVAALRKTLAERPVPGAMAQDGRERDILVAETVIDARDEIERGLSTEEYEELAAQLEIIAQSTVRQLPLPGRIVTDRGLPPFCELRVEGKEYPYLIPEYKLWERFFVLFAHAGNVNRTPEDKVTDDYIELLRRDTFRMPEPDIRVFLDFSAAAAVHLERLKEQVPLDTVVAARAYERQLQREVMTLRHGLLRRVSREGWLEILRRLNRSRAGATWWYRSDYVG